MVMAVLGMAFLTGAGAAPYYLMPAACTFLDDNARRKAGIRVAAVRVPDHQSASDAPPTIEGVIASAPTPIRSSRRVAKTS